MFYDAQLQNGLENGKVTGIKRKSEVSKKDRKEVV